MTKLLPNGKATGWLRDRPDAHDYRLAAPVAAVPAFVDLRGNIDWMYDQGALGSCTANATASAIRYTERVRDMEVFDPARLLLYYDARRAEGTTDYDAGSSIRDCVKQACKRGVCVEAHWPYDIANFADTPDAATYAAAKDDAIKSYWRVPQTRQQIKSAIAHGYTVIIGFSVYESFLSDDVAATGIVPMPNVASEAVVGGHAVLIVGYGDSLTTKGGKALTNRYITMNSWGQGWGEGGYFYMPYAFFEDGDFASDLWVIEAGG